MNYVVSSVVAFALAVLSQFNVSLERCFLQNNTALLPALISSNSPLLVTLPEPIQISDCFSSDQSYLVLKNILTSNSTIEFFIDPANQLVADRRGIIIQARWSFLNKDNGRKYLFWLYFYLTPENQRQRNGTSKLIIKEIRAERH
ncbi:MAG: hypothetical protein PHU81_01360 [Acidobacteriota bacterium]|nr:hypothetical protein [Acidobacteriota bacterium]